MVSLGDYRAVLVDFIAFVGDHIAVLVDYSAFVSDYRLVFSGL